jgi:type IV pilus assembly protein PilN
MSTQIRINLLPHRERRRRRQRQAFVAMSGVSVLAGIALVFLVWTVLEARIASQRARNDIINRENIHLDGQIKEIAALRQDIEALRARQQAVESLQSDRNQPVYLLDELQRLTPEGIYLRTVKQEDLRVTVSGWAASNERVSEFLRNLQNGGRYVERPELIEIKLAPTNPPGINRRLFEFSLNFSLKQRPDAKPSSTVPGAATPGPVVPGSRVPS